MNNIKEYIIYFIKGMAIGLANAIPGVSGGTLAFVLGIYEKLTYSISSLPSSILKFKVKDILESFKVLIPVGLGSIITIFLFLNLITYLFEYFPVPTKIFFVGLILGSLPFISKSIEKFNVKVFIAFFIGAFIMAIFVYFDINTPSVSTATFKGNFTIIYGIKLFFCGIVAAIAMVVPGISGSLLLLILGEYENVSYFVSTFNIPPLIFLGIGVVVGIFVVSKIVTVILAKHRAILFSFVLGIIMVSFLSLWPNITVLSIPMLIATVFSMCIGFIFAIFMERLG